MGRIWKSRNLVYSEDILTFSLIRFSSWNSPVLANDEKRSEYKPGDWSVSAAWMQKIMQTTLFEYKSKRIPVFWSCPYFLSHFFFLKTIKHIWNCCNNQWLQNKSAYLFQRHHYCFMNSSSMMLRYGIIELVTQWLVVFFSHFPKSNLFMGWESLSAFWNQTLKMWSKLLMLIFMIWELKDVCSFSLLKVEFNILLNLP